MDDTTKAAVYGSGPVYWRIETVGSVITDRDPDLANDIAHPFDRRTAFGDASTTRQRT